MTDEDTSAIPDKAPAEASTASPAQPPRRHASIAIAPPEDRSEKLEEWMLTYMDTVTLLVTLFVLMLSFSTVSEEKFAAFAEGMRLDKYGASIMFGGSGIMDASTARRASIPLAPQDTEDLAAAPQKAEDTFEGVLDGINQLLADQGISDDVEVKVTDNLLDLQLKDSVLFASGQAELLAGGHDILAKLQGFLKQGDFLISVEGHTDSVPISTDAFPSNWELSGARAAAVVRDLIDLGIDPARLQTIGHAYTKPVADNGTAEGRQRNRRVNLVLHVNASDAKAYLQRNN